MMAKSGWTDDVRRVSGQVSSNLQTRGHYREFIRHFRWHAVIADTRSPEAVEAARRLTERSNRSILGFECQKPLERGFLNISVARPAQYADTSDCTPSPSFTGS